MEGKGREGDREGRGKGRGKRRGSGEGYTKSGVNGRKER